MHDPHLKLPELYQYTVKVLVHSKLSTKHFISFDVDEPKDSVEWVDCFKQKSFVELTKVGGTKKLSVNTAIVLRVSTRVIC